MKKDELKVINEAVKEKYKYHKVWKILTIVFICLAILFATLYFVSGDVFRQTTNQVEIVNNGDGDNTNSVIINN